MASDCNALFHVCSRSIMCKRMKSESQDLFFAPEYQLARGLTAFLSVNCEPAETPPHQVFRCKLLVAGQVPDLHEKSANRKPSASTTAGRLTGEVIGTLKRCSQQANPGLPAESSLVFTDTWREQPIQPDTDYRS